MYATIWVPGVDPTLLLLITGAFWIVATIGLAIGLYNWWYYR